MLPGIPALPKSSLEQALYEAIVKQFFTGTTFYGDNGYIQHISPPIKDVVAEIVQELKPKVKEAVLAQIVTEDVVAEVLKQVKTEVSVTKLKKEVAAELKAKLIKKLGGK